MRGKSDKNSDVIFKFYLEQTSYTAGDIVNGIVYMNCLRNFQHNLFCIKIKGE